MARPCADINNMKPKLKTITVRPLKDGTWSVKGPWFPTLYTATEGEAVEFAVIKGSAAQAGTARLIIYDTNGGSACRTF